MTTPTSAATASQPALAVGILPVTAFEQNCSLIWCTKTMKGAVVDPGGEVERILAAAKAKGITIEKILLTHGHLDHAGGAAALRRATGVPVIGPHKDEAELLSSMAAQGQMYGLPGTENCVPDQWLQDGDTVTVGEVTLGVRHCPGHTRGHVVFYSEDAHIAFVGDVLFQGSVGRTDFPGGSFEQLVGSITQRLWPLGDDMRFVPGHGPTSTFGHERKTNPFVSDMALGR